MEEELYISVDIEASGPIPGNYSMLSLGACLVSDPTVSFYAELQPLNSNFLPEALATSKLDINKLLADALAPDEVMRSFNDWIKQNAVGGKPVFVGFNACFDWSFVNWYFHHFLNENPFGFSALDIKAYYMGLSGCAWKETTSSQLPQHLWHDQPLTHHALDDARVQARLFQGLLEEKKLRKV